jgi:hypothetical protein
LLNVDCGTLIDEFQHIVGSGALEACSPGPQEATMLHAQSAIRNQQSAIHPLDVIHITLRA